MGRRLPVALAGLILLTGCGGAPDGDANEQRQWARETYRDWTGASISASAQSGQFHLERAGLTCTAHSLQSDPEQRWEGAGENRFELAGLFISYSLECPDVLDDYTAWLDDTDSWP